MKQATERRLRDWTALSSFESTSPLTSPGPQTWTVYFPKKLRQANLTQQLLTNFYLTPDLLLYSRGQRGPATGGESSRAGDWNNTTAHRRYSHWQTPAASQLYHQGPSTLWTPPTALPLPSGKRYRTLSTKTVRRNKSFYPHAVICLSFPLITHTHTHTTQQKRKKHNYKKYTAITWMRLQITWIVNVNSTTATVIF